MMMQKRTRMAVLALHITASVGWIGAVAAYLVFDVTTATSTDAAAVRSAYAAMQGITIWVLVPIALTSWATGVVMGLGTKWGLLRHYWVLISLILTSIAVIVLLVEASVIADLAKQAASTATTDEELLALPHTLPHSVGGLVVLLVVNVLNIVKPRGLTKYGWRKMLEERSA